MDIGIILTTFLVVFFAELGDKTQLVAFSITSTTKNPILIFLATSLALALSSVVAALIGGVTSFLIPSFTTYIAGTLFLGFGFYILFSREPPKIKECFLKSLTLENNLIRLLPKLLKKMNSNDYRLIDILRQEKSHSEVFKILLKEKKLFKDDINETRELEHCLEALEIKQDILKLPASEALDVLISWEKAGIQVFQCILNHLENEEHHQDISLQELLKNLIKEEKEHIRFYTELHEELSDHEQ